MSDRSGSPDTVGRDEVRVQAIRRQLSALRQPQCETVHELVRGVGAAAATRPRHGELAVGVEGRPTLRVRVAEHAAHVLRHVLAAGIAEGPDPSASMPWVVNTRTRSSWNAARAVAGSHGNLLTVLIGGVRYPRDRRRLFPSVIIATIRARLAVLSRFPIRLYA
jgi:hypothetical protein